MKLTLAICTWNRCRFLQQTLEKMQDLQVPSEVAWEILVVDNGSTDTTKNVVHQFADRLPIIYLHQPTLGHARSRNLAIEHATGEWILWTDDDVLVDPNWLSEYAAGIRAYPHASFLGGPIAPVFENEIPAWLADTWEKCAPAYAERQLGEQPFPIPPGRFPYGANFAVRTEVQRSFRFIVSLGRRGVNLMGNDEIELLQRLVHQGHSGMWLPAATVEHFIFKQRATPAYLANYFREQGRANLLNGSPTFGSRKHAFFAALHHGACYWLKRRLTPPDVWVSHLIRSSIAWGEYSHWAKR